MNRCTNKLFENTIEGCIKNGRKTFYNILIDKEEIIDLLVTYQESSFDSLVDCIIEMGDSGTPL
jgi:hypothetical protein